MPTYRHRLDLLAPGRCVAAAFTLVELLVVIAVLVVLVALLLPALGRARMLARRAACQAGLASLGQAAGMYQVDYGNFVPICWRNVDPTDPKKVNPWKSWRSSLLPYTTGYAVFNCPAVTDGRVEGEYFHSSEEVVDYRQECGPAADKRQIVGTAHCGSYGVMYQNAKAPYKTVNYAGQQATGHPVWSQAFSVIPGTAWRDPANSVYIADGVLTDGPVTYPSGSAYKGYGTSAIVPPSDPGYFSGSLTRRFADRHLGTNCLFLDGRVATYETRDLDGMTAGSSDCVWDTD
jgi:prepilin-type processing-associated H-X9-DG protein